MRVPFVKCETIATKGGSLGHTMKMRGYRRYYTSEATAQCCVYLNPESELHTGLSLKEMLIVHAIMIQCVSFLIVPCHSFTSPSRTQSQPALPMQRSPNTVLLHSCVSLTGVVYAGDSCLSLCHRSKPPWLVHSHTSHAFCD